MINYKVKKDTTCIWGKETNIDYYMLKIYDLSFIVMNGFSLLNNILYVSIEYKSMTIFPLKIHDHSTVQIKYMKIKINMLRYIRWCWSYYTVFIHRC